MKISREWLQTYFKKLLPDAQALADALTFHAFEIESVENDVLDVNVLPNRGHDCLSHRGIAKELSAILNLPMKGDPLREKTQLKPKTADVSIHIKEKELCRRYIAGYIMGVTVGPSPDWLKNRLEAIGQKSINNVVDATNYVMFSLGQPLHAFDAGQLKNENSRFAIAVRRAKKGEHIVALDDEKYELSESNLLIVDGVSDAPIGIAGVKGGKPAGIKESTTDIIIESANFDGVSVRRTAAALKLKTDASDRFQQGLSPELAAYGMQEAVKLIQELAGGEVSGYADEYPSQQEKSEVSVSLEKINKVLGATLSSKQAEDALKRLDLPFKKKGGEFIVAVPFERLDIQIPEDLVEEVGRIVGYENIAAVELPETSKKPAVNANFYAAEKIREELLSNGYSEVYTSVFSDKGKRAVLNKVGGLPAAPGSTAQAGARPFLRANLTDGLSEALKKNVLNKDLLGLPEVKLFEIGTVWDKKNETLKVAMVGEKEKAAEKDLEPMKADAYEDLPLTRVARYQSFSKYPFITRDIALWVPKGTEPDEVLVLITKHAGELLVRADLFDRFEKGEKVSFAFRLVFQSFDRTLTDEDANKRMESVSAILASRGFKIR